LADLFYHHLFILIPEARRLFNEDMSEQRMRLLSALLASVDSLDDPEQMERSLVHLGSVHYHRGLEDHQYMFVAHALVRSMRDLIPYDWSSELSSAWIDVYAWMIANMVAGAQQTRTRIEAGLATPGPTTSPHQDSYPAPVPTPAAVPAAFRMPW